MALPCVCAGGLCRESDHTGSARFFSLCLGRWPRRQYRKYNVRVEGDSLITQCLGLNVQLWPTGSLESALPAGNVIPERRLIGARGNCEVRKMRLLCRTLLGPLLCCLLFMQRDGKGSLTRVFASHPETGQEPKIGMLDEGRGLIHLDVSVANAEGEPVSGLHRYDFELLDEDRPQNVQSFHAFDEQAAQPDVPSQVVLFIDTLGLGNPETSEMQVAIEQFLRQNNGHLHEPVSIFGYSEDGLWTVAHHDSTDGNALAADLSPDRRVVLIRHPAILRALATVVTGLRRKRGRKVLLWIGPGCGARTEVSPPTAAFGPTTTGLFPAPGKEGRKTFDSIYWFTALFREARLSIDEISVDQQSPCTNGYEQYLDGVRSVRDADTRFLYKKVLALQSGGRVVDKNGDLVQAMNLSARRAQSFYTLSFDPPATLQVHEYHSLRVHVDQPDVVARTNIGYYDEPFYVDQPNPALRQVTVEQLEQNLRAMTARQIAQPLRGTDSIFYPQGPGLHSSSRDDGQFEPSKVELTERVSFARLNDWTASYKSPGLQHSLTAVADASALLDPPISDISNQATPSDSAQRHILDLALDYLEKAVPKLPDFYATRTTVRYEDATELKDLNWVSTYTPIRFVQESKAKVLYRHGDEVVEPQRSEPEEQSRDYLITHGTFGPLLDELRRAVQTRGEMKWVRWEKDPTGNRAGFEFEVPAAASAYLEGGCCMPDSDGENSFRIQAGYREDVDIDPENGTVVRLQKKFDVHAYVPLDLDEVMIDYGPVKIGGKTYICPVRSVAIARGRSIIQLKAEDKGAFLSWGPYSTKINDMRFTDYHIFRSELRILPGFEPPQ